MLINTVLRVLRQQHFSQPIWAIYGSIFTGSTTPLGVNGQWAEQEFVFKTFQDTLSLYYNLRWKFPAHD